jgi:hypothetical protein
VGRRAGPKEAASCSKLSPPAAGRPAWTEKLDEFTRANGVGPRAGLFADGTGDLHETTSQGGTYGEGVIFEFKQ